MIEKMRDDPEIWKIYVSLPDNPLKNLNSYVVKSAGENLVIDTGFNRPECHEALWEGIQELGLDLARTKVFLTHLHSDHVGLAWDFVEKGCEIRMGRIDYVYFSRVIKGPNWDYLVRLFESEGFPSEELELQSEYNQGRKYAPKDVFPATEMEDGETFSVGDIDFTCIHTPGHTPGHMVLYIPKQQILFTGDHILFDITPNISVWRGELHALRDYLGSLRKVEALPVAQTFPAHRTVRQDVKTRINEILEHHAHRLREVSEALNSQPDQTAYSLASKITWSARGRKFSEFSPHQKWFAVGETLSHLYYLIEEGKVDRIVQNDSIIYRNTCQGKECGDKKEQPD